jgi:hypothetical protein
LPVPRIERRVVEHTLAFGIHYASHEHPDFDAGLTFFGQINPPMQLAIAPAFATASRTAYEFGGQASARYCW